MGGGYSLLIGQDENHQIYLVWVDGFDYEKVGVRIFELLWYGWIKNFDYGPSG